MTARSISPRIAGVALGRANRAMLRRYPKAMLLAVSILAVLIFVSLTADIIRPLDTRIERVRQGKCQSDGHGCPDQKPLPEINLQHVTCL